MTAGDIPITTGIPDQGSEGVRFVGYSLYDALVLFDPSHLDKPAKCTISHHAAARMQQRAIPPGALDLLLEFGSTSRCRGAESFYFDRAARSRAAAALDKAALRRAEKYLNAYAIVADDGVVVTAAWRTSRLRRAPRHPRYR